MRLTFVTSNNGGVESLEHRGAVLDQMVASHCAQQFVDMATTMPVPSDDLHNVIFADRFKPVPDKNDLTVQGIMEKSPTPSTAGRSWGLFVRRQT